MKSTKDKDKTLGKIRERKPEGRRQRLEEEWKNKTSESKKKNTANWQVRRRTSLLDWTGLDCTGLDWTGESHTLGWKGGMKQEKIGSAMLKITRVFQFLL